MEISDIAVRKVGANFEAELRGDYACGDGGYYVSVVGWGLTEAAARTNLQTALDSVHEIKPRSRKSPGVQSS